MCLPNYLWVQFTPVPAYTQRKIDVPFQDKRKHVFYANVSSINNICDSNVVGPTLKSDPDSREIEVISVAAKGYLLKLAVIIPNIPFHRLFLVHIDCLHLTSLLHSNDHCIP